MISILLSLWACSNPATVNGKVLDIWDKPIAGAMIQVKDVVEKQTSGNDGSFTFTFDKETSAKLQDPNTDDTLRFRAGHNDYIHDVEIMAYSIMADKDNPKEVVFHLYPKPNEKGFFGVGSSEYLSLNGETITEFNAPLNKIYGLQKVGKVRFNDATPDFVYHSSLRPEEIKQIDLGLYKLEFKEKEDMTGLLGDAPVEIDLWVANSKPIPFAIRTLDQEEMYVITFEKPLEKGVYAFSGQYIEKDNKHILPEELRVAYPFEIK